MSETMGEKIRTLRKERGLTLAQLAELSGSSKSYIWELENKNPPRPSGEKISAISSVLEVTADYLLNDDGAVNQADAKDQAFYRDYARMSPETKEKLRAMAKLLDGT